MFKKMKKALIKKLKRWITIIIILILGILGYEGCKEIKNILNPSRPSNSDALKDGEKEKIIIDSNGDVKKIKRTKDGKTQVERVSTGAEKVELIIKEDGTVEYREKIFGFLSEPGLNMAIDKDSVLLGVDFRFAHYRNLGLIGGLSTTLYDPTIENKSFRKFRLHLGLGYRLPFSNFRNTSLTFGYNTNDSYQIGVRTKF